MFFSFHDFYFQLILQAISLWQLSGAPDHVSLTNCLCMPRLLELPHVHLKAAFAGPQSVAGGADGLLVMATRSKVKKLRWLGAR